MRVKASRSNQHPHYTYDIEEIDDRAFANNGWVIFKDGVMESIVVIERHWDMNEKLGATRLWNGGKSKFLQTFNSIAEVKQFIKDNINPEWDATK